MNRLITIIGGLASLAAAFGLLARYLPPEVFWPPAVVALMLPLLLLATLLYLLLQLYRRRWRQVALPLTVLLCSLPLLPHLIAFPGSPGISQPEGPALSLVTGNQRLFRTADREEIDPDRVSQRMRTFAADVVLLQEIRPPSNQRNYIAAIKGGSDLEDRHQKEGTLLATYADGIEPVSASFTPPNEYNGYIVSDVPSSIGTVRVINAHLESNQISGMAEDIDRRGIGDVIETFGHMLAGYGRTSRRRAEQAVEIHQLVEQSPHPVIVGGDFNDVPSSFTYRRLLSPRLRDAWTVAGTGLGTTFTGPIPGLRIDYFLVDTSLQVRSVERLDPEWSDHRALRIEVVRPPVPE